MHACMWMITSPFFTNFPVINNKLNYVCGSVRLTLTVSAKHVSKNRHVVCIYLHVKVMMIT